jgi:hypothetical protein
MKTTNNKLEHKDYQLPQGMWHFCIGGKECCVNLTIVWCA